MWALPALVLTVLLTLLLVESDKLREFEALGQDIQMRLSPPPSRSDVALVVINDTDFKEIFDSTRPLNPAKLHDLIDAIAKGKPRVIGVDLNTSDPKFKDFQVESWWPPLVWGRMVMEFEPSVIENPVPERPVALDVLGGGRPELNNAQHSGLPSVIDIDNVTRAYQRVVETSSGEVLPTIPWAVVKKFDNGIAAAREESTAPLMISYAGDPRGSHRTELSAAEVLDYAADPGWANNGYIKDDIVLIGADYPREDRHETPLGEMLGVRIMATVIETELSGGGIKRPGRLALLPLWILQALALILVFQFFPLRKEPLRNVSLTIILVPVTVLLCSLIASRSLAYWSYFVPIAVGVVISQLLDQLNDFRKEKLSQAVSNVIGNEETASGR